MITTRNIFQHPPTCSQNEYKPDPNILTQKVKMIYKQLYRKAYSYSLLTINVYVIWCWVFFSNRFLCCDPASPELHGCPFTDFNYSQIMPVLKDKSFTWLFHEMSFIMLTSYTNKSSLSVNLKMQYTKFSIVEIFHSLLSSLLYFPITRE